MRAAAAPLDHGGFTLDAQRRGDRHSVHRLDREGLRRWAEEGPALQELLRLKGRRRGPVTPKRAP